MPRSGCSALHGVNSNFKKKLPPHGQNILGEILDTTEVIKIAGF